MSAKFTPSNTYWNNKRVIVTGGAGFLGSFVCQLLEARNAMSVIVPRSCDYDLREKEAIQQLIADTSINGKPVDMVIHLAANVGGIGANMKHPGSFFYDNLMMGVQLIHECYKAGIPKFVATGTICAYPKFTPVPFQENDIWDGYPEETNAPYGLAKKMMLVQSESYRAEYNYNSIFLLPVNLYGPRDNFDLNSSHVIPAMIRKCIEAHNAGEESIILWGDGSPSREFLYAEDAAKGLLLAAEFYDESAPVNLGSGREINIADLADIICKATGFKGKIIWDSSKPNGQPRRCLDTQKAANLFGFKSQTTFEEGIKQTVEWYKANS